MAHKHPVYDTDKHFVIDSTTKKISTECPKVALAQHSHRSERFTFEIPKEVEGHDMSLCNVVEIHFQNIEAANKSNKNIGIYKVDDLKAEGETVFGSWLIDGEATYYVGGLIFALHFACVADDGTVEYNLPTLSYSAITIGETVWNSETIAKEHPDIIAQFEARIQALENDSGGNVDEVPDYWKEHLTKKISTIKKLQRTGGADCYSFVVLADYHSPSNSKISPVLIKQVMDECGIKFCLCLGDIQNQGVWGTKKQELTEWEEIEKDFYPIRSRTLMIPGNHDGAYGSADMNGDGVVSGTTDYYIYNLDHNELYDLIYRKVGLINGVTFDESYNGYYVDDAVSKVRYILVNTHYSDDAINEDGTPVNNYMRKIRVGQKQQDMIIDALDSIPADNWNVVVGMHIPLATFGDSGPSGDMVILRNVLEAYQNKTTYTGTFGTSGEYDYVSVNADFTSAKGNVAGVFCGHIHMDALNLDYAFPIVSTLSDATKVGILDGVEIGDQTGTVGEQSFDVITVNKRTGAMNATKIGLGENRVLTSEKPETSYTNLANLDSEDWCSESHFLYYGELKEELNAYYNKTLFVSNFIPVIKNDVLRFKGIDKETNASATSPTICCYDENKSLLTEIRLRNAKQGTFEGFPVDVVEDENGVTAWTVMMRGDTNQQFVYNNYCELIRYVRFSAHWLTTEEDIIITVNEEII